ncbi:MAG TPA: DEAD/DEAH box helicase [Flavipsychrobacter sp.]|nr:DEAD/DEAH box helicase [Flavipsychrobacter sp.]
MITFSSLSLREELTHAVADMGFDTPTPIQAKVIPHLLSEPSDIIGLAQTGTGKTAAFGLPLLHHMDVERRDVQALVLSPTRELCMQIQEEFKKYSAHMRGLKTTAVYGGVPIGGQIRELKAHPQVVVATPGRLIDLLERKALSLESVQFVVLDEADEMLNMGFREDIDFILKNTISRQYTWLFSATMNNEVRGIAKRFMSQWKEYSVTVANTTNENIDHQYYVTNRHLRFETLQRLLDFTPGIYGIIFVRTKQDCQEIAEKLMKQGYHVSPLHGDMDQKMRSKVMERFKSKNLQAIVATDVAARGIDVNDISHVINYELPDDPEVYTHRSGRTARAGKSGICMSIVSPKEIGTIRQIEKLVKKRFNKSDIPDGAEVVRKRLFYYVEQIETAKPQKNFAEVYLNTIHERFEDMDKDELIKRLIWLQLKETIDNYHDSQDLNAGYDSDKGSSDRSVRLFINLGSKDGFDTADKLIRFLSEGTDMEANMISRVTVRDMASFFNVRTDAAEFIKETMGAKKHKGRKIRVDEAEQKPREFTGGGGHKGRQSDGRSGSGGSRGYSSDRNKPRSGDRDKGNKGFPERRSRS